MLAHSDDGSPGPIDVSAALQLLFHDHFCPAKEIAEAQKGQRALLPLFGQWLSGQESEDAWTAVAETVSEDVIAGVKQSLESGFFAEQLNSVWYRVALARRPLPQHPLEALSVFVLLHFADGGKSLVQAMTLASSTSGTSGIDDALAASITQQAGVQLSSAIAVSSVDELHALAMTFGDTLCGPAMRDDSGAKYVPLRHFSAVLANSLAPKLPPHLRMCAESCVRFLLSVLDLEQFQEIGKAISEAVAEEAKPRHGGWSI